LGVDDATAIWFVQIVGREIHIIDYYENHNEPLSHYAGVLRERKDVDGRAYRYGRYVGPHDLAARELTTGRSRLESAREMGLPFEVCPHSNIADGIEAARRLFPLCWLDEARCERGLKALASYRREWDEKYGTWKSRPAHDWASHGADAFRYFAVAFNWDDNAASSNAVREVVHEAFI
jgi:hypothetical protein